MRGEVAYFAHPTAIVDPGAQVGDGTRIWHFCHISPGARLGRDCVLGQNVYVGNVSVGNRVKIQNNVSLYDGVELEDGVFCGPSCVFTNVINPRAEIERKQEFRPTRVRRGVTIGANATVLCGITLGEYAFVGAGAVVTRDVVPYAMVIGTPARRAGWMCACGVKLNDGLACGACGKRYEKKGDAGGLSPL
jgi:UDP-2-acetamido-3-amino-2,3-dideoxy-glucuronate N-acetyltransferase